MAVEAVPEPPNWGVEVRVPHNHCNTQGFDLQEVWLGWLKHLQAHTPVLPEFVWGHVGTETTV